MEITDNQVTSATENDDTLLPEGWAEGDDIFEDDEWSGSEGQEQSATEPAPEGDPAQALEQAAAEAGEGESATSYPGGTVTQENGQNAAPATEQQDGTAPTKFRFKATVDHQEQEVEVGADEVKELYQKAHVVDRVREKLNRTEPILTRAEQLAKAMGYQNVDEWMTAQAESHRDQEVEKLVSEGVHPEVAKDMVDRRMGTAPGSTAPGRARQTPAQDTQTAPARDFRVEVEQLFQSRPDLKGKPLPKEVTQACVAGKPLLVAYLDYETRTANDAAQRAAQERDELRRQLAIEKQNSAAAARAPVKGTSGGGATDTQPEDPYAAAFDADYY